MIFKKGKINDSYIIELEKKQDERGFFARSFCYEEFAAQNISFIPVQENLGSTKYKYTIRGLHYQVPPHEEEKLVRCIQGALYDVIVDVRPESPTFKQWMGVELSSNDNRMLFVPKGCAHGYQTLKDNTKVSYMVSAFYKSEAERGIRWNDPAFNIEWKESEDIIISKKDRNWPNYIL